MYSIFSYLTNAIYLYIFIMYSGADVSAVDKDGNSPLHVAQQARPLADQVGHSVIISVEQLRKDLNTSN